MGGQSTSRTRQGGAHHSLCAGPAASLAATPPRCSRLGAGGLAGGRPVARARGGHASCWRGRSH